MAATTVETAKLYEKKYAPVYDTIIVRGFEIPIPLPVKPKDRDIVNYGLSPAKQKFCREVVPTNKQWASMTAKEQDAFAATQWHHRINGRWYFIKGDPYYIPGNAWFFFNYWVMSSGGLPEFRWEAVEYFLVDDFITNHQYHLGKFVVKSRRIGETEKELCAGYEMTTRFRNSNFGMMNVKDDEAQENFLRLVSSWKDMKPWFRPSSVTKDPKKLLNFDLDEAPLDGEPPALKVKINYRPTKLRSYDGWKLRRIHWDEIGKILPSDINVLAQWAILKECITLHNGMKKVGVGAATTTVEDFGSGKTVEVCKTLWKQSDPTATDSRGRTLSGLVRYFRDFRCTAPVDEWGFHDIEGAEKNRFDRIKAFMAAGDLDGLSAYKRKFPDKPEDALTVPEGLCIMYPALLDMQVNDMDLMEERRLDYSDEVAARYPKAMRGDLVWESGFMGNVKWIPNETSGKFYISHHPVMPNNNTVVAGRKYPGNKGVYTIGVDPVDHMKGKNGGSDFAISIFRVLDYSSEPYIKWIDTDAGMEVANKEEMVTNRFVCTYSNRPMNPRESYEDTLKVAMYYGVPAFIEHNKPGIMFYFESVEASHFLDWKHPMLRIGAAKPTTPGMPTSNTSSQLWQDILRSYVYLWHKLLIHRNLISNLRGFTGDNTTESDLVVSAGFAIAQAKALEYSTKTKRGQWTELPFDTY